MLTSTLNTQTKNKDIEQNLNQFRSFIMRLDALTIELF